MGWCGDEKALALFRQHFTHDDLVFAGRSGTRLKTEAIVDGQLYRFTVHQTGGYKPLQFPKRLTFEICPERGEPDHVAYWRRFYYPHEIGLGPRRSARLAARAAQKAPTGHKKGNFKLQMQAPNYLTHEEARDLIRTRMPRGQVRAVYFDDADCDVNLAYQGSDLCVYLTKGVGQYAGKLVAVFQLESPPAMDLHQFSHSFTPEELGIGPRRSPRL